MNTLSVRLWEVLTDKPKDKWELQSELATWDEKRKVARCPQEREIRNAVTELRMAGFPVVSNSHMQGYWKGNREDVIRTIKEYRSRERAAHKIADAMEKGPDMGQLEMKL